MTFSLISNCFLFDRWWKVRVWSRGHWWRIWWTCMCQGSCSVWRESCSAGLRKAIAARNKVGTRWHLCQCWMHSEEADASGVAARWSNSRKFIILNIFSIVFNRLIISGLKSLRLGNQQPRNHSQQLDQTYWSRPESHQIGELGNSRRSPWQESRVHQRAWIL